MSERDLRIGLALLALALLLIASHLIEPARPRPFDDLINLRLVDLGGGCTTLGQILKERSVVSILDASCDRCLELATLVSVMSISNEDSTSAFVSVFLNSVDVAGGIRDRYRLAQEVFCAHEKLGGMQDGTPPPRVLLMAKGRVIKKLGPELTSRQYASEILRFLQSRMMTVAGSSGIDTCGKVV